MGKGLEARCATTGYVLLCLGAGFLGDTAGGRALVLAFQQDHDTGQLGRLRNDFI